LPKMPVRTHKILVEAPWSGGNQKIQVSCTAVSTLVVPPITSSSSYNWCSCNSSSAVWGTSHQLSPAISRQRLKPKPSAPTIRLSRWAHALSILGDGGVHFDAAACPKRLPLSFGASARSQLSGRCSLHAAGSMCTPPSPRMLDECGEPIARGETSVHSASV